jgi:sugar fermentation stimulation protein A
MMGLARPGATIWLSQSSNPKRKLKWSWELEEVNENNTKILVGINTQHPNTLAGEAIQKGLITDLGKYKTQRREVNYSENSRIDILLEDDTKPPCFVEVKNVHLLRYKGLAEFPDCVTKRGAKHLKDLSAMASEGARAVMLYVIQREDADQLSLAADLDAAYAQAFFEAQKAGVEAYAVVCKITPESIIPTHTVPIITPVFAE